MRSAGRRSIDNGGNPTRPRWFRAPYVPSQRRYGLAVIAVLLPATRPEVRKVHTRASQSPACRRPAPTPPAAKTPLGAVHVAGTCQGRDRLTALVSIGRAMAVIDLAARGAQLSRRSVTPARISRNPLASRAWRAASCLLPCISRLSGPYSAPRTEGDDMDKAARLHTGEACPPARLTAYCPR